LFCIEIEKYFPKQEQLENYYYHIEMNYDNRCCCNFIRLIVPLYYYEEQFHEQHWKVFPKLPKEVDTQEEDIHIDDEKINVQCNKFINHQKDIYETIHDQKDKICMPKKTKETRHIRIHIYLKFETYIFVIRWWRRK